MGAPSICLCVNLRHLWIPPEKLASFVTVFTIEDKLERKLGLRQLNLAHFRQCDFGLIGREHTLPQA